MRKVVRAHCNWFVLVDNFNNNLVHLLLDDLGILGKEVMVMIEMTRE